ncbi:unnamed protein product [Brugia timori]|uniref:Uncharacterized protein n=1 Tax=Brugia timori TaxID=42155 RepID=A0A0R3R4I5_9BILA|nr:unnamed protein product [Brugia timori]
MNTNAACNLEKLVQRLETATLRLEALGAQKPMLAPKPTRNDTSPASTVPCKFCTYLDIFSKCSILEEFNFLLHSLLFIRCTHFVQQIWVFRVILKGDSSRVQLKNSKLRK